MTKLIKTEYILENKTVIAQIQLIVQGIVYNIDCSFEEQALLDSAKLDDRIDWNTTDVIKLASQNIGQMVNI